MADSGLARTIKNGPTLRLIGPFFRLFESVPESLYLSCWNKIQMSVPRLVHFARRFSGEAQGRMSSIEYVTNPPLRRRLSRRVNMTARRNPVKAPSKPSVIERLSNVRRPWPVKMKPAYPIVAVHKIARIFTACLLRWNSTIVS